MSHFNVAGLKEQLLELHETMNEPDFWNDLKRSTEVSRKVRITENKVEHYEKLCQRADDVDTTMELAEEMQDTDLLAEAGEEIKKLQSDLEELRLESLLRGDYDSNNCYLSLHAGAGGTEAQDWTLMLYRMYTRYCERHGFTVKLIDMLDGDEAGLKSVTFEVDGENAYGFLRSEKGVHRLVRISPFDSNARRQTSFCLAGCFADYRRRRQRSRNRYEGCPRGYLSRQRRGRTERQQDQLRRAYDALPDGHRRLLSDEPRPGA